MTSRVRVPGRRCRRRTLVAAAALVGASLVGTAALAGPAAGTGPAAVPAEVFPVTLLRPEFTRADGPIPPNSAVDARDGASSCSGASAGSPDGGGSASAAPGGAATGGPCPDPPPAPSARADGLSLGGGTQISTGGGSSTPPVTVDPQTAGGEVAADELTRTSGSALGDGPVGLLALVATVCLVGVSAGAVRAVVSRRTGRAVVG
jgi:hypothetical protein